MAIALVSGQTASAASTATGSLNVVLPNNPASGNLVVVGAIIDTTAHTLTCSDSASNAYTATSSSPASANGGRCYIFYLNTGGTANKTITVTLDSGTADISVFAAEFSGAKISTPVDVQGTKTTTTNATNIALPSMTATQNGDLYFAAAFAGGTISTANSPWTGVATVRNGNYAEYYVQTTAGAQAVSFTQSPSSYSTVIGATFKVAPAGLSLVAPAGSYAFTGTAPTLKHAWKPVAAAGSYAFTGTAATLTKTSIGSAPVFRAEAHTTYGANDSLTVVNKPTGTVDGDIMLSTFLIGDPTLAEAEVILPAGWTLIGTATVVSVGGFYVRLYVSWKRASSEGSSYTYNHISAEISNTQGLIASYSGCIASGSPVDVFSQNSQTGGGGSSTATATGVTTTVNNTKLVYTGHNFDNTQTLTPPTGMTERFDGLVYLSDEDRATAGATSNRTQTLASTDPWQAYLVALRPSAAAYALIVPAGSYSFTGTAATLTKGKVLVAPAGSYAFTGTAATLTKTSLAFSLAASAGAYNFTGTTVTVGMGLIALAGSYAFTGTAATLRRAVRRLSADAGTYSFAGSVVALTKSGTGAVAVMATGEGVTVSGGTVTVVTPVPWGWWPILTGTGSLSHHDMMLTADGPPSPVGTTSTTLWDSGKHYVETTFTNAAPSGFYGLYDEATDTGTLIELESGDVVLRPAGTVIPTFDPIAGGDVIGIAYDGDAGTVWFKVNDGPWNNDRAQAPDSTGIGLWEIPTDVGCSGSLTPYVGSGVFSTDDQVLEDLDFTGVYVDIRANNVTVRNCLIVTPEFYGITVQIGKTGLIVDHCTISSAGRTAAIITGQNFIVRNCDISGFENGIFPDRFGVIENCYIHDLYGGAEAHIDGIQCAGNIEITNNWIEAWDTSGIFVKADNGPIDDVLIENNTIVAKAGENFSAPIYTTSVGDNLVTNVRINRNRLQAGTPSAGSVHLNYENAQPECFYNIDYATSEPVLLFFQGYGVTGQQLAVDYGLVHVHPVEPHGSSIAVSGNYVGLAGDVFTATPALRSFELSPYAFVADAHVTPPAGVTEGDFLIVAIFRTMTETLHEPVLFSPGWEQLGTTQTFHYLNSNGQFTVWWKRATASDPPAEYLWGFFEETSTQTFIGAYTDVRTVGAIDSFSQNGGAGLTATATGFEVTQDTDLLIYIGTTWAGTPRTPPTGMTEIADHVLYVAEETLTTHDPVGDRTQAQDPSDSAPPWMTTMIALRGV